MKENEKRFEKERCALKQEITRARDNESKEVTEMKEKLHSTQKAHQEYVKKIMDIFETTSAMREGEIAKLSAALRSKEQEKDNPSVHHANINGRNVYMGHAHGRERYGNQAPYDQAHRRRSKDWR